MVETAQEMIENYHEQTFFGRLKKKNHLKRMHALLADMSYLILIGQLYLGRRRMFPTPSHVRQGYPDQEKVGAVVAKVIWHSCLYFVIAFYIVALLLSV